MLNQSKETFHEFQPVLQTYWVGNVILAACVHNMPWMIVDFPVTTSSLGLFGEKCVETLFFVFCILLFNLEVKYWRFVHTGETWGCLC